MAFASPESLRRFVAEVAADLEAAGLRGAARHLTEVQGTAFTTGSEWLGGLGTAVRRIRHEHEVPPAVAAKLERILGEVRRVWPSV
jgi:hypothetical protein